MKNRGMILFRYSLMTVTIGISVLVTFSACSDSTTNQDGTPIHSSDVPYTNAPPTTTLVRKGHLKYVAIDGGIHVYDMDNSHQLIKVIHVPNLYEPRGIAANALSDKLYIPYEGHDRHFSSGERTFGFLLCLDLKTDKILWTRTYKPGVDSLTITPNGETLYMPSGEDRIGSDFWFVLNGRTGEEKSRIPAFRGSHNTITSPILPRVYLASLESKFLFVADTTSNSIINKIGPFGERIRPFAINGQDSLAFVTVNYLSGFEVADLHTNQVIHRIQVEGFPWVDPSLPFTQSHGIALTPDEQEVWVVDAYNRFVHVFDITGLPNERPRQIADIDVRDEKNPRNLPKWINFSRDGRLAHVSTGAIINRETRTILSKVVASRYFIQIDIENGDPIQAYSRYGIGYVNSKHPL